MNTKRMTLTLTLLALVQTNQAFDPLTAGAATTAAFALGVISSKGPQKEIKRFDGEIERLKVTISGREQSVGGGIPAVQGLDSRVTALEGSVSDQNSGLVALVGPLIKEYYGERDSHGAQPAQGFRGTLRVLVDTEIPLIKKAIAQLQEGIGCGTAAADGLAELNDQVNNGEYGLASSCVS